MAHQWSRANLSASAFPLYSGYWGRSIMIAGTDENDQANGGSAVDKSLEQGIPQIYYCENVMPATYGYQTVSYSQITNAVAAYTPDQVQRCRYLDATGNNANCPVIFSKGNISSAKVYTIAAAWVDLPFGLTISNDVEISSAFINGVTYFFVTDIASAAGYTNSICFKIDFTIPTAPVINIVVLTGITQADLVGIAAANGYMIACSRSAIAWSSQTTPTDFTPSLLTGAGGGDLAEIKGNVVMPLALSGGLMIYCDYNVVQGSYTGNNNFPYKFQEVAGSGGIYNSNAVSWQDNFEYQWAFTTKGLQKFSIGQDAQNEYPEITEFFSNGMYDVYDPVTKTFSFVQNNALSIQNIRLNLIESQYLVISFVTNSVTQIHSYLLVLDLVMKRFGKLKYDHVDTFDMSKFTATSFNKGPKNSLALLDPTGKIYQVVVDPLSQPIAGATGVLLLGKYQIQRNRGVYHQRTDIESSVKPNVGTFNFTLSLLPTIDGKNFLSYSTTTKLIDTPYMKRFANRVYGANISLLIEGTFSITSVLPDLELGGYL